MNSPTVFATLVPSPAPVGRRAPKRGVAALLVGLCLGLLGACTTVTTGGGNYHADEDTRHRAMLRMELAARYFESGKTEVALEELREVQRISPNFPDVHTLRGLIQMQRGEMPEAEASFKRALSLNARDPGIHHNLGWLYCQQGRYPEAERAFEQAVADPTYRERAKTLMAEGACQVRAGDRVRGEATLKRAYADPGNPAVAYNLALLLFQNRQPGPARIYIQRVNAGPAANAESLWLGMRIERQLGNANGVRTLGQELRQKFPDSRELTQYERGAFDER